MDIHQEPQSSTEPQPNPPPILTNGSRVPSSQPTTPIQDGLNGNQIEQKPKHHDHDGLKSIISTLAIIILAPLIAFSLTACIFQSYEVDGESMQTTLQNQDRLIVLKVPRTWAKITGHPYIPHRGDVIIFNKEDLQNFGTSGKKQLVKRVMGLPGDRVVVKNGVLKIFDSAHPNGFEPDKTLPYGSVIKATAGSVDLIVPPNQIFVCGDNRSNSLDSRYFGTFDVKDVVGKLTVRIFPFNKFEIF